MFRYINLIGFIVSVKLGFKFLLLLFTEGEWLHHIHDTITTSYNQIEDVRLNLFNIQTVNLFRI